MVKYKIKDNNIRVLRAGLKMNQEQLAKDVGCSTTTINSIENNKKTPGTDLAYAIAKRFEKAIEDVFIFEEVSTEPVHTNSTSEYLKKTGYTPMYRQK